MSELKVKGTIKEIHQVEKGTSKSGKDWEKQSFVLDTRAEYNPLICFSLFGDKKIQAMQKFKEGQDVEVYFNASSREYNSKWYHNLDAWRLVALGAANQRQEKSVNQSSEESDDLPF